MTQTAATPQPLTPTHCLAQADVLLGLAHRLRTPADAAPTACAPVHALLEAAGWDGQPGLASTLATLDHQWQATPRAERLTEHHRLFDGAMACPPNEAAYVRRDKGAILGDICGFYRAFGFELREQSGDRPDHLAAELEFVAMLLVMLAQAMRAEHIEHIGGLEHDDESTAHATVTRAALHAFAEDHVDPWLAAFADRLGRSAALPCHAALAAALTGAWAGLMRTHAITRAEHVVVGEPMAEAQDISACGLADADAQATREPVELRVSAAAGAQRPADTPHR